VFCSTTLQLEFESRELIIESPHVHQSDSSDSVANCVCICLLVFGCIVAVLAIGGETVSTVISVCVGGDEKLSESELMMMLLFPCEELSVK
jgi:hypothetical protein